jgi:type I restriction enzyme S subunit
VLSLGHEESLLLESANDLGPGRDQIKQVRQTILNFAVRGKLVPQDPRDEPASELLKWIATEKARRVKEWTLREQKPCRP